MMERWLTATAVVGFMVLLALGYWLGTGTGTKRSEAITPLTEMRVPSECSLVGAGCVATAEDATTLRFQLGPVIEPLKPFAVSLQTRAVVRAATVRFDMVGMDMGHNEFRLKPQADGAWGATVLLPVCATGRRDWVATLRVETNAATYSAVFPFETR